MTESPNYDIILRCLLQAAPCNSHTFQCCSYCPSKQEICASRDVSTGIQTRRTGLGMYPLLTRSLCCCSQFEVLGFNHLRLLSSFNVPQNAEIGRKRVWVDLQRGNAIARRKKVRLTWVPLPPKTANDKIKTRT